MKKVFRYFAIFIGIVAVVLLGFAAWVQWSPLPSYRPGSLELRLPTDSSSLALGRSLVVGHCGLCHLGDDGKLSGRIFSRADDPFGELWARNLTQHPTKGLPRYTNGELAYLMRTGVKRDGHPAGYFMSSLHLSDADQAAIIAFLRSDDPLLAASESDPPLPKYAFLAKALLKFGVFKPLPYDGQPVVAPPPSDQVAYGKYLVTGRYECYGCHSSSFETMDPVEPEKSEGYLGGGNPLHDAEFQPVLTANITPSKTAGIGAWTKAQFAKAVRSGQRPDQRVLNPAMPRLVAMSDEEVDAIWAYLQTVPAVESPVGAAVNK